MNYEKLFNEKIDSFKGHIKYPWLRKEADAALSNRFGFGLPVIIADDFMDRIVAMPKEYIQDWLDGKNKLEWRREDELMLGAGRDGGRGRRCMIQRRNLAPESLRNKKNVF